MELMCINVRGVRWNYWWRERKVILCYSILKDRGWNWERKEIGGSVNFRGDNTFGREARSFQLCVDHGRRVLFRCEIKWWLDNLNVYRYKNFFLHYILWIFNCNLLFFHCEQFNHCNKSFRMKDKNANKNEINGTIRIKEIILN